MPTDDYIKRSDAIAKMSELPFLDEESDIPYAEEVIMKIPAADVEPVRHGRWIPGNVVYCEYNEGHLVARYYDRWTCSVCNYVINDQHYSQILYKRCPECGTKMDKEEENENRT